MNPKSEFLKTHVSIAFSVVRLFLEVKIYLRVSGSSVMGVAQTVFGRGHVQPFSVIWVRCAVEFALHHEWCEGL